MFVVALFIVADSRDRYKDIANETESVSIIQNNPFENISIRAKAVFVWDVNKQKALYSFNEEAQLPLASLSKLMTALTAVELLSESAVVTIERDSLNEEGDSGLFVDEKWKLRDLLDFTLLVSSNDGADAIASAAGFLESNFSDDILERKNAFAQKMNEKANEIGLTQTYFINSTGLDISVAASGGYGSARDIALLLEYIILNNPQIVDATRYSELKISSLNNIEHIAKNTNDAVNSIPGLIASKTGFTNLAGGNLVIAFDAGINHPIIVSVLGSTEDGRFIDVEKLVAASLQSIGN